MSIVVRVVARTITFDTMELSVPVTASWAPMTSLFSRLMRAPVQPGEGDRHALDLVEQSDARSRSSADIDAPALEHPTRP
jgi:hypothetical protein